MKADERVEEPDRAPVAGKKVVDVTLLPDLPPPGARAWGRSGNPRRWRSVGCIVVSVFLVVAGALAYFGLRSHVWSAFEETCRGLETRVLVQVTDQEKMRFWENLRAFRTHVAETPEPYPLIGSFVNAGRKALFDWAVDEQEVDELNRLMEELMTTGPGGAS